MERKTIAVIFGGQSVEHDVSVLTGLQFLDALDPMRFDGLPVYVAADGTWWTGGALRKRSAYPVKGEADGLAQVTLPIGRPKTPKPYLAIVEKGMFGSKEKQIPFDLIVPAIHGSLGEDGTLQGLLEFLGIPYAGTGHLGSAATMDKDFTKRVLKTEGVPVLPNALIRKPETGLFIEADMLKAEIAGLGFPLIAKPQNLGSSVGVKRVEDMDGLQAALVDIFRMDKAAVVEPFVPNLREYNIAVSQCFGGLRTSVIERPLREAEVLDFKNKYLAGGSGGPKLDGPASEGMASTNRVINPEELTAAQKATITHAAEAAGKLFDIRGTARIDFLCNEATGEIWFNEVNSIPGSFAYYLWQASEPAHTFTDLASAMVDEGFARAKAAMRDFDTARSGSAIFRRA